MSESREISTRRRLFIVGVFVALLIGAGVLNAVVKRHDVALTGAPSLAVSPVTLGGKTSSTAWYCPGPLPLGHKGEVAAIAITNLSSRNLTGQMHIAINGGGSRVQSVAIGALHEAVVGLPPSKSPTYGAVSLLVDGPGVGVSELIHESNGMTSSPCSTHTSSTEYFAVGSSAGADNIAVSLFNPGATPAVVNLSFFTGNSSILPAGFTSVPVEPGQDVVYFVGRTLPLHNVLSAQVTTVSGQVVAGNLDFLEVKGALTSALVVGSPVAQSSWWFGPVPVGPQLRQVFALVNPTTRGESVHVTLAGAGVQGVATIAMPPHASLVYNPSTDSLESGVEGAFVDTSRGGAVVVEREFVVSHRITPSAVKTGLVQLPDLFLPGFSVTAPTPQPSTTWLLASGQSNPAASEIVGIVNPHKTPVTIKFKQLVDGTEISIPGLAPVTVASHQSMSINMGKYVSGRNALALLLTATKAVVAGATEFSRVSAGVSAPAPTPVR